MPTIDADAHVIESERTWDYVENPKYKPQLTMPNSGGPQYWMIDGKAFRRGVNVDPTLSEADREMRDIGARLRHMDELEIDIQVLYPSLFLRPLTSKPEVEKAICRSYNRWLIDICNQSHGRLRWIATVPMLDMPDAVDEIRFARANGACGIFSRGLIADKRLSHPFFDPLYAEAEKANLPFCVHASTGNFDWVDLFDGESGFSRFKMPVLCDNHVYVACQTDDDLPYILKYSGEDNIVIGSDYGHKDTSAEIEALRTLKRKGDVDPKVIDKILYDNAKALYGL